MPWLRHDRARPALLEFGQCARQDRRHHIAHHAARTIGVRDLTPRGHARTRTKPVGRTLARIPVRIPEDPQRKDRDETAHPPRQTGEDRRQGIAPGHDEREQGGDHGKQQHDGAHVPDQDAFLIRQCLIQARVPVEPDAQIGILEPFPFRHGLASVLRVEFLGIVPQTRTRAVRKVPVGCQRLVPWSFVHHDPPFPDKWPFSGSRGLRMPCAVRKCQTSRPNGGPRREGSCADGTGRYARCRIPAPIAGSCPARPRSDREPAG